jgi:hypothetical protein
MTRYILCGFLPGLHTIFSILKTKPLRSVSWSDLFHSFTWGHEHSQLPKRRNEGWSPEKQRHRINTPLKTGGFCHASVTAHKENAATFLPLAAVVLPRARKLVQHEYHMLQFLVTCFDFTHFLHDSASRLQFNTNRYIHKHTRYVTTG